MKNNSKCLTMSVKEAAKLLGISYNSLYRIVSSDKDFPAVRAGGRILIPRARFFSWLGLQEKK